MMKQFIAWALSALVLAAAFVLCEFYFGAKWDCAKEPYASTVSGSTVETRR
ncbi:hypothetical protein D3C87_1724770 [compost metagenome]